MWIFIAFFILFGIVYAFLARKQEQKVQEQFSTKPDLLKHHAVLQSITLNKSIDEVWPYLTTTELYKQWHPGLQSITPTSGEFFTQNSKALFYCYDGAGGRLEVEIIERKDKEHVAFCIIDRSFAFERYEWLLLEPTPAGGTKLTVSCDYRHIVWTRHSFLTTLRLNSLNKVYRKTLEKNLSELQRILG